MPKKPSTRSKSKPKTTKAPKLEEKLLQNLVSLQKVHTNLAEKFDNLSDQISKLLALFEMSAKTLGKQQEGHASEKDKKFLEKIDKLLDQNKTLAKGLTIMEERMREKIYGSQPGLPRRRL